MFPTVAGVVVVVVSVVVRACSCRKPMYKSLQFTRRGRARTRANVRESASEMWSSAEPASAPAPASATAPIYKPGLCTNGRPTHLVTVKALPLSLPSLLFFSHSLTHSRSTLWQTLSSALLFMYVPQCTCACVCERACVLGTACACLPARVHV